MIICPATRLVRAVACLLLLASLAVQAAARPQATVPSVVGMRPDAALESLRSSGFTDLVLKVDGVETAEADVMTAMAVVVWTSPPEWGTADGSSKLEVGFETKVRVANHVGQTGGDAKIAAERIGYVLVEGDPATATAIPSGDTRIVESYHSSSPPPGTLVSVGSYVGVILVAPAKVGFGLTSAVVGAIVGAVIGAAVVAAAKPRSKAG